MTHHRNSSIFANQKYIHRGKFFNVICGNSQEFQRLEEFIEHAQEETNKRILKLIQYIYMKKYIIYWRLMHNNGKLGCFDKSTKIAQECFATNRTF
jgi:hypothetical protein